MGIYKRLPKNGDTKYTPIIWRKCHGEGEGRKWTDEKLKIGHIYDISADEPGQELYFKAEFLGWKKVVDKYDSPDRPDYITYVAIFKSMGNIIYGGKDDTINLLEEIAEAISKERWGVMPPK